MPLFAGDGWLAAPMTVRPPALNEGETRFLWDLRAWWLPHHDLPDWTGVHLYVLRNPASGGLLLYRRLCWPSWNRGRCRCRCAARC